MVVLQKCASVKTMGNILMNTINKLMTALVLLIGGNNLLGMDDEVEVQAIYVDKTGKEEQSLSSVKPSALVSVENTVLVLAKDNDGEENTCEICGEFFSTCISHCFTINIPSCCSVTENPHIICSNCVPASCPWCRKPKPVFIPLKMELLGYKVKKVKPSSAVKPAASTTVTDTKSDKKSTDKSSSQFDVFKNRLLSHRYTLPIVCATGAVSAIYAAASAYSMTSRTSSLDKLNASSAVAMRMLLSLDFDLLNPTSKILPLAQQYDIYAILQSIKDEQLKEQLRVAITEFDVALEKTYAVITASYYYQSTDYFLEKEQTLVAQLTSAQANLKQAIDACKSHKAIKSRDFIKCGLAMGLAAVCGYYYLKNRLPVAVH